MSRSAQRLRARRERQRLSRRELLKLGLATSGAALVPARRARADDDRPRSPQIVPFQQNLLLPEVATPVRAFTVGPPDPQCSLDIPGFPDLPPPLLYEVSLRTGQRELFPGKSTEFWGYDASWPGPTFRVRRNRPIVVRVINDLDLDGVDTEISVHNHGGHTPFGSDGFPDDFVFGGEFKDYCYPNIAPDDDDSEFPSTQWYHDHAMDVTGQNVYMGMSGFYLLFDDLELDLINSGVLPRHIFDIPLVFQDRRFDQDGALLYNPLEHDGVLGDRFCVNGVIQPKFHVQRRKYRFRMLNGSNARLYALRLSNGQSVTQIATDSWLLPNAVQRPYILLGMAERADVIIDFTNAPDELFLENILLQDDGTGPDDLDDFKIPGTPLMKFIVGPVTGGPSSRRGPAVSIPGGPSGDATIEPGDPLRPHVPITADEIVRTRHFIFDREDGAWTINERFFDPDRDDADPDLGTAERWILENDSGGWVHPIHIHLEAHQVQSLEKRPLEPQDAAKKDTVLLGPDEVAEVFMKFRTFPGRFVFHCHNIEHEDMRMMGVFHVYE